MRRNPRFVTLMLVTAALAVNFLSGVENGGSVGGVVKDQSGKPVTGALVKVKNNERGLSITVISQQRGRYRGLSLPAVVRFYASPSLLVASSEKSSDMELFRSMVR